MPSREMEDALATVRAFCESRFRSNTKIRYGSSAIDAATSITIVKRRPPWKPELVGSDWSSLKVAQLRCEPKTAR